MTTGTTTLLSLALPVQGELSGQWGNVVNYGITDYLDISIAGTLTLTGDGAVTLANTTGSDTATNITSTTAQYAVIKIAGTLTTTKVITAPSYSKIYIIDHAATGGSVTIKASGQTGVSVAVGERCTVYFNGTDYVKVVTNVVDGVSTISFGTTGLTPSTATSGAVTVAGTLATTNGGTGLTAFTSGGLVYASSTSALTTGSAMSYSASTLNLSSTKLNVSTSGGTTGIQVTSDATAIDAEAANVADTGIGGYFVGNQYGIYVQNGTNTGGSTYPIAAYIKNTKGFSDAPVTKIEQAGSNSTGPTLQLSVTGTSSTSKALYVASGAADFAGSVTLSGGAANGVSYLNGSKVLTTGSALTFDGTNLGLGVTLSSWIASGTKVFQLGSGGAFVLGDSSNLTIGNNASYLTGWTYTNTYGASRYDQQNGVHRWYVAPSGTAGTAITFTQAMTLDASGNLSLAPTGNQTVFSLTNSSTAKTDTTTQLFERTYTPSGTISTYGVGTLSFKGKSNNGTSHIVADIVVTATALSASTTQAPGTIRLNTYATSSDTLAASVRINSSQIGIDATGGGDEFLFTSSTFVPNADATCTLGSSVRRWTTVYATTGTINTSDGNQKQDIADLDEQEKRVAVRIKALIKKFRFKDAVAAKGEAARIHVGVIAQDVRDAFIAEGLDANRYAMFCSDTWTDEVTKMEVTQLGVRYEELLAFVIAAM
jgi:hypothetical protein